MCECILRLNNMDELHQDLQIIREVRNGKKTKEPWDIGLDWTDEEDECHRPVVHVEGPALSVKGYTTTGGALIDFTVGKYNYNVSDSDSSLQLPVITQALLDFEGGKVTTNEIHSQTADARRAYVMCVFVTSEIVRNEVLEALLDIATRENIEAIKWKDYCSIYSNWASVSSRINGGNQSENAAVIYIDGARKFLNLEGIGWGEQNSYRQAFAWIDGYSARQE